MTQHIEKESAFPFRCSSGWASFNYKTGTSVKDEVGVAAKRPKWRNEG